MSLFITHFFTTACFPFCFPLHVVSFNCFLVLSLRGTKCVALDGDLYFLSSFSLFLYAFLSFLLLLASRFLLLSPFSSYLHFFLRFLSIFLHFFSLSFPLSPLHPLSPFLLSSSFIHTVWSALLLL